MKGVAAFLKGVLNEEISSGIAFGIKRISHLARWLKRRHSRAPDQMEIQQIEIRQIDMVENTRSTYMSLGEGMFRMQKIDLNISQFALLTLQHTSLF
ncbi:hypothetical protein AVEN_218630-1 [Araneus ventricosus]|uniref:Uncharacterized protein n=1 Tax=Araneus ventricosus TaxID=182803 RepID=A0A4Y2JVT1_ARAVE|nr:hypothetical protein AVEN_218630-1 [Araneus ventricosus]